MAAAGEEAERRSRAELAAAAEQNAALQREVAELQRRRAVELGELQALREQVDHSLTPLPPPHPHLHPPLTPHPSYSSTSPPRIPPAAHFAPQPPYLRHAPRIRPPGPS